MDFKPEWNIKEGFDASNYLMQFSTNFVIMLAKELKEARSLTTEQYVELLDAYQKGLLDIFNHYQEALKTST